MNGPRIPVLLNQWVCNVFMFSARAARKRNRILLSQNNFSSRIFSFLTELLQKLSKTLLASNQLSEIFDKPSLKNTDARVIYERISSEIFKNLGRVIYERTSYMNGFPCTFNLSPICWSIIYENIYEPVDNNLRSLVDNWQIIDVHESSLETSKHMFRCQTVWVFTKTINNENFLD